MEPLEIRRALPAEAVDISALIRSVAQQFTLSPNGEGAERLLATITPEAIEAYAVNPRFSYFAGRVRQRLAGVVAVRDGTHLFHLFVAPEFQRRGIARRLWDAAKADAAASGNRDGFTVNSTPYAVPVYERFGFQSIGPKVEQNGIAFVPMRFDPGA